MIRLQLVFLTLMVIGLTACAAPAAQPTLTPPPPSATPCPADLVSVTALPPSSDSGELPLPQPYAPQLTLTPFSDPSGEPPIQPATTPCLDDVVSATPLPPGSVGATPLPPPYAPQPGDKQLERGEVFIDGSELITAESSPPQFFVTLAGSLPTPCHQLRLTASVEANSQRIVVTAYSLANPQAVCVQMLEPFNVNLPLSVNLPNLPSGKYEVWVNSQSVGEIVVP